MSMRRRWDRWRPERPRWRAAAFGAFFGATLGIVLALAEVLPARHGGPIFGFSLLLPNVPFGALLIGAGFAVVAPVAPWLPHALEPVGAVVFIATLVVLGPAVNFAVPCWCIGWTYERFLASERARQAREPMR